jgi:nucleotide-binding universal stress UspA family protein
MLQGPFQTIVVGADGSDASMAALAQARALLAEGGTLSAVTVCEERLAIHAGFGAGVAAKQLHREAEAAHEAAAAALAGVPGANARLVHGLAPDRLLAEATAGGADLLAVGAHGHGRAAGILVESVATTAVRLSPAAVLLARADRPAGSGVVVGTDGSPPSLRAIEVAQAIAAERDVSLREVEAPRGRAVGTLLAAAADAGLLVVGSRGLQGLRALGSVSARVAHRARCSVLVVRDPCAADLLAA